MIPKCSINLTGQLVHKISVGTAVILKYNPTQSLSTIAAPYLFSKRANEYLI